MHIIPSPEPAPPPSGRSSGAARIPECQPRGAGPGDPGVWAVEGTKLHPGRQAPGPPAALHAGAGRCSSQPRRFHAGGVRRVAMARSTGPVLVPDYVTIRAVPSPAASALPQAARITHVWIQFVRPAAQFVSPAHAGLERHRGRPALDRAVQLSPWRSPSQFTTPLGHS